MPLRNLIDRLLERLQWPMAWLAMLLLPCFVWGSARLMMQAWQWPWRSLWLAGGLVGMLLWGGWLARSPAGSWVQGWLSSIAQAGVAIVTGHPVVALSGNRRQPGQPRFLGRGNWLITLAPYALPMAAVVVWPIGWLMPAPPLVPWHLAMLGGGIGWHLAATLPALRRGEAGVSGLPRAFRWMILPAANVASVGLVVAFALGGGAAMLTLIGLWLEPLSWLLAAVWPVGGNAPAGPAEVGG